METSFSFLPVPFSSNKMFSPKNSRHWSDRRILMLLALGTLIVSVIWRLPEEAAFLGARMGEILVALTLAMAMTYVLRPIVVALTRFTGADARGRSIATLLSFLLMCLVLYLVALIGFKPIQQDLRELTNGFATSNEAQRAALMEQWRVSLLEAARPYRPLLPEALFDDPRFLSNQLASFAPGVRDWVLHQRAHIGFIVELLLVPVLAFYFLADGPAIRQEMRLLCPATWRARAVKMGAQFDFVMDGYVRGQVWMCVIAWVLVTLMLWALNVPHAVTLGFIAGLTRAIPVVGPLIGGIPLALACLFYTKSLETTGVLLVGFTLMHFLESKVLLPKIVGHHVDLHPVSVIVSLLIGMEFFGTIGVFLAVPIAAVLKILLAEYHDVQAEKLRLKAPRLPLKPLAVANANGNGVAPVELGKTPPGH